MKRIIYSAAIAALLVTSCQKTDVLNVVEDAIAFGTEVGKLTKAEDYTLEKYKTLTDQGFRVWVVSDFTSAPHTDGSIYNDMNGLDVEYKDGWGFVNKGKYMWPQSGQHLYFYTISSDKTTWLDDIKNHTPSYFTTEKDANSVSVLELPPYTVGDPDDLSVANDDIMVANHLHQDKGPANAKTTVVRPNFRHTMTKVEFNFKKGSSTANASTLATTVVLKSVEISPVSNVGNLKVTYGDTSVNFDWTADDPALLKAFKYTAPQDANIVIDENTIFVPAYTELPVVVEEGSYCKVGDKIYISVVDETETLKWEETTVQANVYSGKVLEATADFTNYITWYMIPQDLDEDQVVTITYEADSKVITQKFALTVDGVTEDWTEETCVRYNVTIAPHKIVFKPSVDGWVENPDTDMNL